MYTHLTNKKLSSGEPFEIGVVQTPDKAYETLIKTLLGHKPHNYQWHLDHAFADQIDGLETRFYLGLLNSEPICNIMTVEYMGIGILGHVYTFPAYRRKGACRLVMTEQMLDFKGRGGKYLTLGTGYNTPPFWIYHSFGFRGVLPNSGHMKYKAHETIESDYFARGKAHIISPDWKSWPGLNVLCSQHDLPLIRNIALGHVGPSNYEGGYISLLESISTQSNIYARILVSDYGSITGYATIIPDSRWQAEVHLLDCFVHPEYKDYGHLLIKSLPLPDNIKVQCYTDVEADWKIAALLEEGFDHEATFRNHIKQKGQLIDVEVYTRRV